MDTPSITFTLTAADARALHFMIGASLPFLTDENRRIALRLQAELVRRINAAEEGRS